jgi:glycosyltransferase involved in cell wall biosynthesis
MNAQADGQILVNSLFSREAVLRAYGVESRVCYPGIDTSFFTHLGLPRERFVVGLGTLGPTKNVELAIRAIGAMKGPRPPLHWIGNMSDGPYLDRMTMLAAQLEVEFRPKVMVSDDELVRALNQASAMIYTPRLEPFGLSPLEANACGCPVVAVAEGGVRETIEDGRNGFLCSSEPEDLARRLTLLVEDEGLSARMGAEAREWVVSKWSISSSVDKLEDELRKVSR